MVDRAARDAGVSERSVEVDRARMSRWAVSFVERHGEGSWSHVGDDVLVHGADGARARLVAPWPGALDGLTSVGDLAGRPELLTWGVILVRRGGYALGVARAGELLGSKVGTRYVQGRTAAGGWSQQRYQRRRENQASALAGAVADHAVTLLVPRTDLQALATGGDAGLLAQVLADPRLARLAALPRRSLDPVADPRRAVLDAAARRVDSVHVIVTEPEEATMPTSRELLPQAAEATRRLVGAVPGSAWQRPSPCEQWTARGVLNHLTAEQLWAPHLLRGESLEQVGDRYDGDVLGDDPVGAFGRALDAALAAWADAADDARVQTSAGVIGAEEYCQQMLVDLTVHGWDIARATAAPYSPVPEAVAACLRYMTPRVESTGQAGIFAGPVSTRSADRTDQLVALLGRDPAWRS